MVRMELKSEVHKLGLKTVLILHLVFKGDIPFFIPPPFNIAGFEKRGFQVCRQKIRDLSEISRGGGVLGILNFGSEMS